MARVVAIALATQLVLSAFAWAVGASLMDTDRLPSIVFMFMRFAGPTTFLMHGPQASYVYFVALGVLVCAAGLVLAIHNTTAKKWLLGCGALWWVVCGVVAAAVGV